MKNAISASSAANCIALDSDFIGSIFEFKWTRRSNKLMENTDIYYMNLDHSDINFDINMDDLQ